MFVIPAPSSENQGCELLKPKWAPYNIIWKLWAGGPHAQRWPWQIFRFQKWLISFSDTEPRQNLPEYSDEVPEFGYYTQQEIVSGALGKQLDWWLDCLSCVWLAGWSSVLIMRGPWVCFDGWLWFVSCPSGHMLRGKIWNLHTKDPCTFPEEQDSLTVIHGPISRCLL